MKIARTERNERGSAVVEAALTMLTFLVILFAVFEAGRLLSVQQTLNNASREGAKLAVLPQAGTVPGTLPTRVQVKNEVNRFIQAAGINGATISINGQTSGNDSDVVGSTDLPSVTRNGAEFTEVTVTVPYQLITTALFSMLQVNLRGEASMRNETSP